MGRPLARHAPCLSHLRLRASHFGGLAVASAEAVLRKPAQTIHRPAITWVPTMTPEGPLSKYTEKSEAGLAVSVVVC